MNTDKVPDSQAHSQLAKYKPQHLFYYVNVNCFQNARWIDGEPVTYSEWYTPGGPIQPYPAPSVVLNEERSDDVSQTDLSCTAVVGKHLAVVERTYWVNIPCKQKYKTAGFVCKERSINQLRFATESDEMLNTTYRGSYVENMNDTTFLYPGEYSCPLGWNFIKNSCFKLVSSFKNITEKYSCAEAAEYCALHNSNMAKTDKKNLKSILLYLKSWLHVEAYGAIWLQECNILAPDQLQRKNTVEIDRPFKVYNNSTVDVNILNVLCQKDFYPTDPTCGQNQFRCGDGTCILNHHACDSILDCADYTDEENCTCGEDRFVCDENSCISSSKYCDMISDCADRSDEKQCKYFNQSLFKRATVKKLIPLDYNKVQLHDPNYRRGKWYAAEKETFVNYGPYCDNETHVRCYKDHPFCIPRYLVCTYMDDLVQYCPDGIHLQSCKAFQCPDMFKCPDSYCIPYHHVCDGTKDCEGGVDELNCSKLACPGLFKCRSVSGDICIDMKYRCDGVLDCPLFHEDELLCDLFVCPANCFCNERSVDCSRRNITAIPDLPYETRSLNLSFNQITPRKMPVVPYLMIVILSSNGIEKIQNDFFETTTNIHIINLSHNKLTRITNNLFFGLKLLRKILLSHNHIQILAENMFSSLHSLHVLDIRNNVIESIDNSLSKLEIKFIMADERTSCCFSPKARCIAPEEVFSSCSDLIRGIVLKVVVWFLAVVTIIGNVFVIIWRVKYPSDDKQAFLVLNLSISDLLMGIYLTIIAATDIRYKGHYAYNAKQWQKHVLCKICAFMSTLSSEVSVCQLVLISMNRWCVVARPYAPNPFTDKLNKLLSAIIWIVVSFLSIMPFFLLDYFGHHVVKNGVCLMFNVTLGLYPGWEYITFVFLLFNGLAFLFMLAMYSSMQRSQKKTRHATNRACSLNDRILTRKFALIVLTNAICWLPFVGTAILGLTKHKIDPQLHVWLAVLILPVNSSLNPYLYSYVAVKKYYDRKMARKGKN